MQLTAKTFSRWIPRLFAYFALGWLITMILVIGGLRLPVVSGIVEWFIMPGWLVVRWFYGGFEGGEAFFPFVLINTIFYGVILAGLDWLRRRQRTTST